MQPGHASAPDRMAPPDHVTAPAPVATADQLAAPDRAAPPNHVTGVGRASLNDEDLVRLALDEAIAAPDTGDVPIGAVVLSAAGGVLGTGHNSRESTGDPTAHAEMLALRAAAAVVGTWNLSGCTLAVTVEPCTMCAGAAVLARIERVVFGCWEPKTGAAGSLWDVLRDRRLSHRVQVRGGVLEDECAAVLREFFAGRRS
jgi:tRNA(adenine34) deaminase